MTPAPNTRMFTRSLYDWSHHGRNRQRDSGRWTGRGARLGASGTRCLGRRDQRYQAKPPNAFVMCGDPLASCGTWAEASCQVTVTTYSYGTSDAGASTTY